MRFKRVVVKNYRTLNDIELTFDESINFIVGRNNIGKSNFLRLLEIICLNKSFNESDFSDIEKSIEIELTLQLSDNEKGMFDDYFSPSNNEEFKIAVKQESAFDSVEIKHYESQESIPNSWIRKINYLFYDSMRKPMNREDYSRNSNNFNIVPFLVDKFYEDKPKFDTLFSEESSLKEVLSFANLSLGKIDTLKSNDLKLDINEEDSIELLKKVMVMKDDKGNDISKMGYGVQFANMIPMSVINELIRLYKRKSTFSKKIQIDENDKKYIEYVMGIDEPEIHLHPHLQRRLINYLQKIFSGKEKNFNSLIKSLFGIDYIKGQLFIVTHSPLMLLNDYKQIIRIYDDNDKVKAISGSSIIIEDKLQKHLEKSIGELQNSFFSKVVVFVEGDSEVLAMKEIAKREKIDLDESEIEIVSAGSVTTIPLLSELYSKFFIKNVSIIDRDDDNDNKEVYTNIENIYITEARDFEYEMFEQMSVVNFVKYIEELNINDEKAATFIFKYIPQSSIDRSKRPVSQELEKLSLEVLDEIKNNAEEECIKLMKNQKSVLSGKLIAEFIDQSPQVYKKAMVKARSLSHGE